MIDVRGMLDRAAQGGTPAASPAATGAQEPQRKAEPAESTSSTSKTPSASDSRPIKAPEPSLVDVAAQPASAEQPKDAWKAISKEAEELPSAGGVTELKTESAPAGQAPVPAAE